jgi:hypothetical protein
MSSNPSDSGTCDETVSDAFGSLPADSLGAAEVLDRAVC